LLSVDIALIAKFRERADAINKKSGPGYSPRPPD
jgi:hypothetical protein